MSDFYCIRPKLLKTIFERFYSCRYKLLHISDYSNPKLAVYASPKLNTQAGSIGTVHVSKFIVR